TEVDVEINVLADDGGVLAACMMAAGVAVSSANIEMFDTVLACSLMIAKDGTLLLDPTASQIESHREKGTFGATLTVAIVPSLGQIICAEAIGVTTKKELEAAVDYGFQKCLLLHPVISKALRATVALLPL
ncbi:3' exoribonuclease familydomain 1 containing protein, partial [Aphelenchoides avenae]